MSIEEDEGGKVWDGKPMVPCKLLERTLVDINSAFSCAQMPYWLAFGGLWGLIANRGIVPDCDMDLCTFYGEKWGNIAKAMKSQGYSVRKVLLDDSCPENAVYMGFDNPDMTMHICLSFWFKWGEYRFWCHDQNGEIKEQGKTGYPNRHGYFFKGCPAHLVDGPGRFVKVEWPGIPQNILVRVPVMAGSLMDLCYPAWGYWKQRYNVSNYEVDWSNTVSYNNPLFDPKHMAKPQAGSPYRVHVMSMKEWQDDKKIGEQLRENIRIWEEGLVKRFG